MEGRLDNAKKLWSVSPSQVMTFNACGRSWYNNYILGDRPPPLTHLSAGTAIHAALEHYLKTAEVLIDCPAGNEPGPDGTPGGPWPTMEFVQAAIPFLPSPLTDKDYWTAQGEGSGLMLEQAGEMATFQDGPKWTQYIDKIEFWSDRARITDFKTTSDFRYSKTPDELAHNVQLCANAQWLFSVSDYKAITLRHLYLLKKKGSRPKAKPVEVEVTREHIAAEWEKILATVREMVQWAKMAPPTADPLQPNTEHCSAYGGCYYRQKCGFTANGEKLFSFGKKPTTTTEGRGIGMNLVSLMEQAKNKVAGATPAAPVVAPPAPAVAPPAPVAAPVAPPAPVAAPIAAATASLSALFSKAPVGTVAFHTLPVGQPTPPAPVAPTPPPALTPETAQSAAVAAGYPETFVPAKGTEAPESEYSVVPPDAPSPISTPEEIAAANAPKAPPKAEADEAETTEAPTAEAPKARRGRPKKDATTPNTVIAVDQATIAAAQETLAALTAPPAEVTAPKVETESDVERTRKMLETPDAAWGCGVEVVFVDCLPGKGWPGEQPRDLLEFMHAFNNTAAASAKQPDYRLIRYESKGYLATAIRVLMKGLPKSIYVDSRMPGADIFLETVTPYVRMIMKGTR